MKRALKRFFKKAVPYIGIEKESAELLARFYNFYGYKCKKEIVFLFIGAVISGVIELFGLILLYILIRVMIDLKSFDDSHYILRLFHFFGLENKNLIIPFFGGSILFVFILKNIYIMFYYQLQHLTLRRWKTGISNFLMERYLYSPYIFLLGYNSATVIRNVSSTVGAALNGFVLSALIYASNLITGVVILMLLFAQYASVTLVVGFVLVISTILQNRFLKAKQKKLGEEREELSSEQTKSVYQGLHAVKETKVVGKEKYFLDIFRDINIRSIDNEMKSMFYSRLPAHLTEIVIIFSVLIITVAVLIDTSGNIAISVSTLGVLGAIAFRLAPIMNRTVSALQSMNKSIYPMKVLFSEVDKLKQISLMSLSREKIANMPFEEELHINQVSFRYPRAAENAISEINVKIKKGEFIGVVGSSGAGKTTLVDVILGLFQPSSGVIVVDGVALDSSNIQSWQKNIGYVPQSVYMSDGTIAENVAFGVDTSKIDRELVDEALEKVQLKELVESKPEGIDFVVGENGKNLSGGQKQRVGIARALYLNSNVLVLDEATSALDVPTEVMISEAINRVRGEKTIIVIAHRLSTVFDADKIIYMEDSRVVDVGSYKELFQRNEKFNELGKMAKVIPVET